MDDSFIEILYELRREVAEIPAQPWGNIHRLITNATPLIREFYPSHYEDFVKATKEPHWLQLPRVGRIGQPYDNSMNRGAEQTERAAHAAAAAEGKARILSFIDGLIRISTIRSKAINTRTADMNNPTEQNMSMVLATMNELAHTQHGSYVDDTDIATKSGLTLREVQDYMDLLAEAGLINPANSATGHCAELTARGRTKLRDPEFQMNNSHSFGPIIVQNNKGVVLNIGSTLNSVTQAINVSPNFAPDKKEELSQLIEQLSEALKLVPAEKADDADAVAETAKELVDRANKEKPNPSLVRVSANGLKEAAQGLAAAAPTVFDLATKIADFFNGASV